MPLTYPESLVKIFQLKVGEIVNLQITDKVSTEGSMQDAWTTETLSQPIPLDRSTTPWSGLKTKTKIENPDHLFQ